MNKKNEVTYILNDMVRHGVNLEPMNYLAYVFGPYESWPEDREATLPGVFKFVDEDDQTGIVKGCA